MAFETRPKLASLATPAKLADGFGSKSDPKIDVECESGFGFEFKIIHSPRRLVPPFSGKDRRFGVIGTFNIILCSFVYYMSRRVFSSNRTYGFEERISEFLLFG